MQENSHGGWFMRFGIGQPVTRKEDPRFLTGRGRYVADIDLARQAHAVFIYSAHAHARIRSIDKTAAQQTPGVHAVLTGADWSADGLGTLDPEVMAEDMGGPPGHRTKHPPLATDRVRYVGERVAVVVAATEAQARDAAEIVSVDYEVLPAVAHAVDAARPGPPWSMMAPPTTSLSRCIWVMPTQSTQLLPARVTSLGSHCTITGSPR
jgi:carbon-monoxide dehydrogenase large subunit